ncbi:AAA family ATPase [bacterium]|nr:AAA family ATPase [bacterium]
MTAQVFRVDNEDEYRKAGPTDLVQLLPTTHGHPLYMLKWHLQSLVDDIVAHEFIHVSGPTGSAKSSLIEAVCTVPANFEAICSELGHRVKPVRLFPVEMAVYETPGELYQRRAIRNGTTFDEPSQLVQSLTEAADAPEDSYNVVWLREMGRVHAASVQGGLLDLMTHDDIVLPDGRRISGHGIAWIADSNYQAAHDSTHTLVTLDDALRRRFGSNLTIDYLPSELESVVLQSLAEQSLQIGVESELVNQIVLLGRLIRRHRSEGNLQSLVPPTIHGYLSFLRKAHSMPGMTHQQVAQATILGNADTKDKELLPSVMQEVFGMRNPEEDKTLTANLF